jgi:hypothetical protein
MGWRVGLGAGGVFSLFVIWLFASTTTNLVPSPVATWDAFIRLWRDGVFVDDLRSSSQRIAIGYGISVALGIVFGVAMGTFASAEAFFEPQFGFPIGVGLTLSYAFTQLLMVASLAIVAVGVWDGLADLLRPIAARY